MFYIIKVHRERIKSSVLQVDVRNSLVKFQLSFCLNVQKYKLKYKETKLKREKSVIPNI